MSKQILYLGLDPSHFIANGQITHFPIIQIVPRPLNDPSIFDALSQFELYSHILVTSKTSVAILKDYLPKFGISLQLWRTKSTVAVGKVTAQHLEISGINPLRIAQEETAEGLIKELMGLPLKEAHVFWPHSSQARSTIKEYLISQNIKYTACMLYDPKPNLSEKPPSLEQFDEIVFTSPSTVDAFLQIYREFPTHAHLSAIGPITSKSLKSAQATSKIKEIN